LKNLEMLLEAWSRVTSRKLSLSLWTTHANWHQNSFSKHHIDKFGNRWTEEWTDGPSRT